MPSIDELIASIEVELEAAEKRRNKSIKEVELILASAAQEGRSNLTEEEDSRVQQLEQAREAAKSDVRGIKVKLERAKEAKSEQEDVDRQSREVTPTQARRPAYDEVARVGAEERTYHAGNDRKGAAFMQDVVRQFLFNDVQASTRLARHMQEERVERAGQLQRAAGDATTSAFTGLVIPQYLTELYAPAVSALRPFADKCNHHDLPASGMTFNISRITTSTSVENQSAELAASTPTSIDDTLLPINVKTAFGEQTMSRQAIERGTGTEEVTMADLFRKYATNLNSTLLTETTTGMTNVATATTYDDAAPSGSALYPKILAALSASEEAFLAEAIPDFAVMHSRRWYWLSSQMTATWPFINSNGIPVNAAGVNNNVGYDAGTRGLLPNGLQVIVDNNVPTNKGAGTNQDEIYIVASSECHLWEDPDAPVFLRAEQAKASNLGVLMVIYGYYAYTFQRYSNGMRKVSGTGLVTPQFS